MQQSQNRNRLGEYDHTVKIIFLGDFLVNKKQILQALASLPEDSSVRCLSPGNGMVEMLFVRDEKRVRVKISDTGGQERFRSITSSYYRGIHGCLLLFDVAQKSTFDSLNGWQSELHNHTMTDDIVVMLAGCDVGGSGDQVKGGGERQRQVSRRLAQDFASYLGGPYREVRVKEVDTIVHTLEELVDRILVKASRVPQLSTAITPLEHRLEDLQQQQQQAGKGGICGC